MAWGIGKGRGGGRQAAWQGWEGLPYKDPGRRKGRKGAMAIWKGRFTALRAHHGFLGLGQGQGCMSGGVRLDVQCLEPL